MLLEKLTAFGGGVECPHCHKRAEKPGRDIPDGIYSCRACKKPFATRRISDTVWYSESVGICPRCYSPTRISLDGLVVTGHRNVWGRYCGGVGLKSLTSGGRRSLLKTV